MKVTVSFMLYFAGVWEPADNTW